MPIDSLTDLRLDDDGLWCGERRVSDRGVPIVVDAETAHTDAWRWAEDLVERLEEWDERARGFLVTEAGTARTTSSNYVFSLSSIAAPRFLELFGRDRWNVDFGDYARTLRITRLRLNLAERQARLEYGLEGCVWRERLHVTLHRDGTLVSIASTRGGKTAAELDWSAHGLTYLCLEHHLDNDTLVRAVDSLGVPGLAVFEITRGYVGAPVTSELVLEGPADSLAIARMLRDTLACVVLLSASFGGPWQWLLLDPQRGEWLVDEDERDPHLLCTRSPFRFDRWEKRPAAATGLRASDWTPRPFDGDRPEPRNHTNLVLPRDVPISAIEAAIISVGGTVLWTSMWDHCCTEITFACAASADGSLAFARSLASALRREVVAGMLLRDGPAWVRFRPDGQEDLVHLRDDDPVQVLGPFDASTIEVPPPRAEPWPPPERGPTEPLATSVAPPAYTNVYVSSDVSDEAIDAAVGGMRVEAVLVWRCCAPLDHRAIVLRSTADPLSVARAIADTLGCRVIVGLALRAEPGWVVIDPGEGEWIGEGWDNGEELRYLRRFEAADLMSA